MTFTKINIKIYIKTKRQKINKKKKEKTPSPPRLNMPNLVLNILHDAITPLHECKRDALILLYNNQFLTFGKY